MAKRGQNRTAKAEIVVRPKFELTEGERVAQSELLTASSLYSRFLAFVQGARALETSAHDMLTAAKTWTTPTNLQQDAQVVADVRNARERKNEIVEYWRITKVLTSLRDAFAQARDRGVDDYDEVIKIGTGLHNKWDQLERERVQREAEAKRLRDEAEARAKRQAELDALEAQRTKAEEIADTLSDRELDLVRRLLEVNLTDEPNWSSQQFKVAVLNAGFVAKDDGAVARIVNREKVTKALTAALAARKATREAQALAQEPIRVASKGGASISAPAVAQGSVGRWKAHAPDARKFLEAALDPVLRERHNIPLDTLLDGLLEISGPKLNHWVPEMTVGTSLSPAVRFTSSPSGPRSE